jgi:glycosyltransferase involved in cell wall biosynthesis
LSILAIVIPYYKRSFFENTLQSLANQTDLRFKVYIGDDASKQDCLSLLEKFKGKFNYDYRRFESNLGSISLVKQWERCLEMTQKEEWIMVLGDDDTIDENCVASFYTQFDEVEKLGINVMRYASLVIDENDLKLSKIHFHPKIENSPDFLIRKLKGGTRSSLSEYVFRKSIVESVGFKDLPLAWHSDILAVLEFSNFDSIYTINCANVNFRISGLNITSRIDNLVQKNIASFQFYYYLLHERSDFFDNNQSDILYKRLEKTFLDNKMNLYFWVLFTRLYLSKFKIKGYLIFITQMMKSIYIKISK